MNALTVNQVVSAKPLTVSRFIAVAAMKIINAGIFANDTREAAAEAKRIWKRHTGGMYKKVQADSRRILRTCAEHGITVERPYLIRTEDGFKVLYVVWSDGKLLPVKLYKCK